MSSLSMVEAKLPPGFRFHPRDDELVCDYLLKKWNGSESALLIEVDLNKCEPWDIPATACVGDRDWFFYSQRDRKYATGLRTNRATVSGYWKATGKDRPIFRKGNLIGMRKTLVFYQGRAPKGKKSDWVMHEFRIEGPFGPPTSPSSKEDWVLCRVFNKYKDQVLSKSVISNSRNCMDETNSSSSLPPLMDPYISFNQTPPNTDHSYQQVPCFSNYSPSQNASPLFHQCASTFGGAIIPATESLNTNNPLASSCDKQMIEAVLSHLTKMESSPSMKRSPSIGEASASSDQSYLSEVALPPNNMWSHY